jgi:hypothetical protein
VGSIATECESDRLGFDSKRCVKRLSDLSSAEGARIIPRNRFFSRICKAVALAESHWLAIEINSFCPPKVAS